jgi:hypothetical protein
MSAMVTISITAETYVAIAGRAPDPSESDDRGGFGITVDRSRPRESGRVEIAALAS